jgi:serine acetyltransferase
VARHDEFRRPLVALNDRVNIGATLRHDVHLASFVTFGPGTVVADVMTSNTVVTGVPASVVTVRDG